MKKIIYLISTITALIVAATVGGSFYMLSYSLTPDPNRRDLDSAYSILFRRYPEMRAWTDSMKRNSILRDTFITINGERHHAIFARNDSARGRTAIIVHGYKDCAVKFLFLGKMYFSNMKYNILLPDLHAHGLSDGEEIQMGWKDRKDVMRWTEFAEQMFRDNARESRMLVHGVSMGAATTMNVSGEDVPEYIRCFVEDCGYTSVWDEFKGQLGEQFSLPAFPLMHATSLLCKLKYGWNFKEASPLRQVAKCRRPMLFIHGASDKFVPTWMVHPLYNAKTGTKELWITPNTDHAESFHNYPDDYTEKVGKFIKPYM